MKFFFLISLVTLTSISAMGQSIIIPPSRPRTIRLSPCRNGHLPAQILIKNPYKIKVVTDVNSGLARVADYVEFKTMEPIYSIDPVPEPLFPKDTPIYAVVTWRKHRAFPFRRGQLEIALEPLVNWDGSEVQIAIKRHGPVRSEADEAKRRNKPCKRTEDGNNCVAGRVNAEVAPVVTAIASAATGTVGAIADDDKTRFIAATAFFSLAKDLSNLLNGTDADIKANEIFDLYVDDGSYVCKLPKPQSENKP